MASVMENTDDNLRQEDESTDVPEKALADNRPAWQAKSPAAAETRHGFFAIYKKGQGYWTRMGTAGGAVLLGGLIAWFLYTKIRVWTSSESSVAAIVATAFLLLFGVFAWWLQNKPANADFLIATDSEMKKVNWTSMKDLIGSTKVVILFMFMIAAFLFLFDIGFGYFFWVITVLKTRPF